MRRTLVVGTAAALGLAAGALLGWLGWVLWVLVALYGFCIVLGLCALAGEIARPFMRARRQLAAEQRGDWWGFAGGSRID